MSDPGFNRKSTQVISSRLDMDSRFGITNGMEHPGRRRKLQRVKRSVRNRRGRHLLDSHAGLLKWADPAGAWDDGVTQASANTQSFPYMVMSFLYFVNARPVLLATSFGPFRRFNLAHLGTLWVR
jgi:hypothetical protein